VGQQVVNVYECDIHVVQQVVNVYTNVIFMSADIHSAPKLQIGNTSPHIEPSLIPTNFTFSPASREEICKLIWQSSNSFCDLDPIPTFILKQCLPALLPTVNNIVNLCLSSDVFPQTIQALLCCSSFEKVQSR